MADAKSSDPATPPKFGTCTYSAKSRIDSQSIGFVNAAEKCSKVMNNFIRLTYFDLRF